MLEQYFRPLYQKVLVNPAVKLLSIPHYCSANLVTLMSLLAGLAAATAIILQNPLVACLLLLLSGYFDTLDGSLAREQQCASDLGCVLDIVADRCVEFMIIFALFLQAPASRAVVAMLMLGSVLICITSFLVVGIFSENNSQRGFHYSPGIMERAEAFAFFIAMILWPSGFLLLGSLFTFLVMLTALIRLWQFAQGMRRN